jgi:hypothetical protein
MQVAASVLLMRCALVSNLVSYVPLSACALNVLVHNLPRCSVCAHRISLADCAHICVACPDAQWTQIGAGSSM